MKYECVAQREVIMMKNENILRRFELQGREEERKICVGEVW